MTSHTLKEVRELEDGVKDVKIAGRIVFMRKMGKLSFARIRDLEASMQLEVKIDTIGEENYNFFNIFDWHNMYNIYCRFSKY